MKIFAFADEAIFRVSRPEDHMCILSENNIYYTKGAPLYRLEKGHLDNRTITARHNLLWDTEGKYEFVTGMPLTEGQNLSFSRGCYFHSLCYFSSEALAAASSSRSAASSNAYFLLQNWQPTSAP